MTLPKNQAHLCGLVKAPLYSNEMHIGTIIRQERKRLGMSQDELGARLKVTGKAVSQWERGKTEPDHEKLPAIAEILGVPLSKLAPAFKDDLPGELISLWKSLKTEEAKKRALDLLRLVIGAPVHF